MNDQITLGYCNFTYNGVNYVPKWDSLHTTAQRQTHSEDSKKRLLEYKFL